MALTYRQLADRFTFAHELQSATSERQLLTLTRKEIQRTTGYRHAWLYLLTPDRQAFELVDIVSEVETSVNRYATVLPVAGDQMLQEIATGKEPVVVRDARVDPRTDQEMVRKIGCVTIINIPIHLPDYPLGGLGTGTFLDEGVRPPSADDLLVLVDIGDQVAIALARIRNQALRQAARRERDRLLSQLALLKRQESLGRLAVEVVRDLNQLLSIAQNCAARIKEVGLSQGQDLDLNELQRVLDRLSTVTSPLSRFGSRHPSGGLEVNLNHRIVEIVSIVERILSPEIEIDSQLQPELPLVLGDAAMLDQVLLNLILATREALPSGGHLGIRTRSEAPWVYRQVHFDGNVSLFSDRDENLEMTLCRHIVGRHDGTLEVQVSAGQTRIEVKLPAR